MPPSCATSTEKLPDAGPPGALASLDPPDGPTGGAVRVLVAGLRGASGIATYTKSLVTGLAKAGHEVVLLDETLSYESAHARVTVAPAPRPRWNLPRSLAPFEGWGLRGEVERLARTHAVDIVHATHLSLAPRHPALVVTAWDPLMGPLARYRAAPSRGERPGREAMYAIADRTAIGRSAAVVAVTPAVRDGVAGSGRRTELIPPFLADDRVRPGPAERSSDFVFVARGLDDPRKGLSEAIDAVSRVRDTVPSAGLILVGSWSDAAASDALPGFCDVRGELTGEEVQGVLRGAGGLIIASSWEEFGFVGLEALAVGTPVVCGPLPAYERMSGGGVFPAATRTGVALAEQALAALRAAPFDFPAECRASTAIPALLGLYRALAT